MSYERLAKNHKAVVAKCILADTTISARFSYYRLTSKDSWIENEVDIISIATDHSYTPLTESDLTILYLYLENKFVRIIDYLRDQAEAQL